MSYTRESAARLRREAAEYRREAEKAHRERRYEDRDRALLFMRARARAAVACLKVARRAERVGEANP